MHDCVLKWSCKKQVCESQNQGGAGNTQLLVMTFQLVTLDSTAGSNQLTHVMLAHNLMMSSTRMSTNNGQRTDSGDSQQTDSNYRSQGSQNGQQTPESLI